GTSASRASSRSFGARRSPTWRSSSRRRARCRTTPGTSRRSAGWRTSPLRTSSSRLELGAGALLVGVAFLAPGVGVDVVPAGLPEPTDVVLGELEPAEPLRALPRVALRHDEAKREPVLRRELLAVVRPRHQHVVLHHRLEGEVGRVAEVAVRDHPLRLRPYARLLGKGPERDSGPRVVERRPPRDAVHVGHDVGGGHRRQLGVRERDRALDQTEHLEPPLSLVEPRDRAVVEHRPALHQALAGRDALGDLLRIPRTEQRHPASSRATREISRQAAIAVSMSSSEMSTWVTIRTFPDTSVAPTPCSSSRRTASRGRIPTASVSTYTMFVSTAEESIAPGKTSPMPSARRRARAWSSWRRFGPSSKAMSPAAAMIPACRHAPPNRILSRLASRMSAAGPHTSEPIGAPRPLDTQNIIVSASRVHSVTSQPAATAALKIRAPSRWIGSPASPATLRIARRSSTDITVPPAWPWVFSTAMRSMTSTS